MTDDTLARIRRAARTLADTRTRRDQLIRHARTQGHPLRAIAAAAGLTHPAVKKILDRQPTPKETP